MPSTKLILSVVRPRGGRRLKKLVAPAYWAGTYTYPQSQVGPIRVYNRQTTPVSRIITTDLDNNDLRFWYETANVHSVKCRACGERVSTMMKDAGKALRVQHMEATKCTAVLVKAYSSFNVAGECGICAKKTNESKWGVNLCFPCQETWKIIGPTNGRLVGTIKGLAAKHAAQQS